MITIAICDDSTHDIGRVIKYLKKLYSINRFENMNYMTFLSGRDLVNSYDRGKRFDLLFMDMLMKPLNGIETAKMVRKYDSDVPIIIVTSSPHFAVDGYEVQAVRYLLKPLNINEFIRVTSSVLEKIQTKNESYFLLNSQQKLTKVRFSDIFYFESDIRDVYLKTSNYKYQFKDQISSLEKRLPKEQFIRVHKSYIVNLQHIHHIEKVELVLDDKTSVPLSKHRKKTVTQTFLNYVMEDK